MQDFPEGERPREPVDEMLRRSLIQLGDMDAVNDSIRSVGERLSKMMRASKVGDTRKRGDDAKTSE